MILAASETAIGSILPRLCISMVVVIAVMWIAARVMKGRQVPGSGGLRLNNAKKAPMLQVLARQGLGRHASVTVVRAGDKALVLGITDAQVSLLAEIDHVDLQEAESHGTGSPMVTAPKAIAGPSWKGLLEQARERTVRR